MSDAAEPASCEDHPEAERVPCERCGDFFCPDCAPLDASPRCGACRKRYGIEDVAWEVSGPPMPRRWRQTTRAFVTRPARTLERTRPQRAGAALGYLFVTWTVTSFGVWLIVLMGDLAQAGFPPPRRAAVGSFLLALALAVMTVVRVGVFHGVARALGGSAPWRTSVASVAYVSAVFVVYVPLSFTTWVPSAAPLAFSLAGLAIEAIVGVNLTTAARQYHGLATGRAAVAAWAPFVFVLGTVVLGCGFLGALMDASALPT